MWAFIGAGITAVIAGVIIAVILKKKAVDTITYTETSYDKFAA